MQSDNIQDLPKKKSKLLILGVVILGIFLIGQYAAMYIPAYIGTPPKQISIIGSVLWSSLFFMLLWKLLNMKKIYGFILGATIGLVSFFGASFLSGFSSAALAKTEILKTGEWVKSELNESYMKSIDKNKCMEKTVSFLNQCDTDQCLKTMAGVSGDCVTYAKGSTKEFCKTYQANFISKYCLSGKLSYRACKVIEITKSVQCK